ncbi:hypothetical protein ACFY9A_08600 [Streptomyces rubradiris]|uniref:hypothetical protein n=1 Tax=Streptomyces rubradiris TaxID=285531 RepID=UPI0036EED079
MTQRRRPNREPLTYEAFVGGEDDASQLPGRRTPPPKLRERHEHVDLGSLWLACLPAPHPEVHHRHRAHPGGAARQRWGRIIDAPAGARRVRLSGAAIADRVRERSRRAGGAGCSTGTSAPTW